MTGTARTTPRTIALLLVVLAVVLLLGARSATPTGAQPALSGDVPTSGGVGLVRWSGGSLEALETAAREQGCDLRSAWVTRGGRFIGIVLGAAPFANAEWADEVAAPDALPDMLLILVCGVVLETAPPPGLDVCDPVEEVEYELPAGFGLNTAPEAMKAVLVDLVIPDGALVVATASETRLVWELVAPDGVVIGEFTAVRGDDGWRPESARWCA